MKARYQKIKETRDAVFFVTCYGKRLILTDFKKQATLVNGVSFTHIHQGTDKTYLLRFSGDQDAVKVIEKP